MWMFKRPDLGQCVLQQHQLLTSLTTFTELYRCREDYIKTTADSFARLSAQAQRQREESRRSNTNRALFGGFCGASLGGACGALGGCVAGGLGSVCAAAVYSKDLNPLSATTGFFGGVLGGAVGATFAGAIGGALGAAGESVGVSADNGVYNLVWCIIGGATGAGIGHIFGGEVGLLGGAFGGNLGGLLGVCATVSLIKMGSGQGKGVCQDESSQRKKNEAKTDSVIQTFKQNMSLLVAELININNISSKLDRTGAHCVSAQSSTCLSAVSRAEKVFNHLQYTAQTTSCLEKAAKECKEVSEEFEKMKCEAEKLLALWSK